MSEFEKCVAFLKITEYAGVKTGVRNHGLRSWQSKKCLIIQWQKKKGFTLNGKKMLSFGI